MKTKLLFALAAVSMTATVILFSIWLGAGVMGWIQSLPQAESRALTPLLIASSTLTVVMASVWRHARNERKPSQ